MKMNPVVHFEMGYKDAKRVCAFYSEVFGWQMQQMGKDMSNYVLAMTGDTDDQGMVKNPGMINGGFYENQDIKSDSTTHVVISVDDVIASVEKVKTAGGEITSEPMDIPGIGKYVSFKDSEGNSVGMLQPVPMGA